MVIIPQTFILIFFNQTFKDYCQKYHRNLNDFAAIAYHLPFTKMGLKALRTVITEDAHSQQLLKEFDASKRYNALVGNLYTGSLYLSLLSLLANSTDLKAGDRIGLFSYGSGAQGEFYSGTISDGMHADKMADEFESVIADRVRLSVSEYEKKCMRMDCQPLVEMLHLIPPMIRVGSLYSVGKLTSWFIRTKRDKNRLKHDVLVYRLQTITKYRFDRG